MVMLRFQSYRDCVDVIFSLILNIVPMFLYPRFWRNLRLGMELSFASLVHPQVTKRGFDGMKTSVLTPSGARKSSTGKMFPCFATVATRLSSVLSQPLLILLRILFNQYGHKLPGIFASKAFFLDLLLWLPFLLESSVVVDLHLRLIDDNLSGWNQGQ